MMLLRFLLTLIALLNPRCRLKSYLTISSIRLTKLVRSIARFLYKKEEKLEFDLDYFNRITKGGIPQKTLNIALAGTGVGKSLFMCHMAASTLMQGKNVLYITLEMAEERIAERIDALYKSVIIAGTHLAPSIKVAEAAKVIENTQRDLNIALINELAMIFERLDIDTEEVLQAAGTKWNFLPFRPGLVGGHCIGVDPYYLTHKAQEIGYHPEVILAGRKVSSGLL